jgi:hypothetical protein
MREWKSVRRRTRDCERGSQGAHHLDSRVDWTLLSDKASRRRERVGQKRPTHTDRLAGNGWYLGESSECLAKIPTFREARNVGPHASGALL